MLVSGMNSADNVQNNQSGQSVQSIDQKIMQLRNEMKKIKENDKIPPEEKEKRIKKIEEKIKRLEEQKEKMKKKESEDENSGKGNSVGGSLDETAGNHIDTTA